jgi:hypothetical protein
VTPARRRARAWIAACGLLIIASSPAGAQTATEPPPAALDPARAGLPLLGDELVGVDLTARELVAAARPRRARITETGRVIAPANAPPEVRKIIAAGNRIAHKPYVWGGGHGSWRAAGYDCSGSVGYALHGAGLIKTAVTSGSLTGFGRPGAGRWVTVYAHGGHTYMVVAGVRFDTTAFKQSGSRWSRDLRGGGGYVVRHPAGL